MAVSLTDIVDEIHAILQAEVERGQEEGFKVVVAPLTPTHVDHRTGAPKDFLQYFPDGEDAKLTPTQGVRAVYARMPRAQQTPDGWKEVF